VPEINLANKKMHDAAGLSSYNKATVKELATAVSKIYATEPYIFDITTLDQYVGKYDGWVNNSPVIALEGYKGGKHGYTEAAGRTLVAIFTEPALGNKEVGYILLGSEDLLTDIKLLRGSVQNSVSHK
jgi:D-alanyl-D-alanine carboxypeptidase